ncbi:hypothetical protein H2200_004227 [Cladophialophora chaetospira]|uniref:Ubiquitin 3 binding protein But2 C-terminal domain-containing protein n=1 Tax=Cladophialophora chaetospira TaxID=386627 RepID=A0AA38XFQ9_9EURO|nr:hypothetical protein H2200_004227 [Cladophialophora chaetospira]
MYTQSIVAGLLSIAALTSAAPLTARTQSNAYPSSNDTSISPAPPSVQAQPIASILPDFTSQYTASTGAIDFHTSRGLVSRSPQNGGADITTLVTFELPEQYANNQCQLVFDFGSDSSSSVTGTGKAQLFTSLAPADQDTSTWPSGNLRNQNLGTIQVNAYGRATWEAGSGPGASSNGQFPCSAIAGKIYGGEVVPVGDVDTISWAAGLGDGPKILVW